MTYTIQMDIFIDGDEIVDEETLKNAISESLETSAISVSDFKLIDVND